MVDEFGRCSARFHGAHCIQTVRGSAATGNEEAAHAWRGALLSNTTTTIELASAQRTGPDWDDQLAPDTPADLDTYTEMRKILGITGLASGPQAMRPVRRSCAGELGLG